MPHVVVLIPTCNRNAALAAALTSLAMQTHHDFSIVIANQGGRTILDADYTLTAVRRLLELHGNRVTVLDNLPRRGMGQQRHFLLERANAPYALFLDDDVLLEPFVIGNLLRVMEDQQCGFVGNGLIGLSFIGDYRSAEEAIELWKSRVTPEIVTPGSRAWQRHKLHNAANVSHVQQRLGVIANKPLPYKVAWVGGCVLYDTAKLRACGGFAFWKQLPTEHAGEDVLAQLRVMKRYGGCGALPSGAYHQELPTTITNRKVDAPLCLPI